MSLGKVIFIDTVHEILWERLVKKGWICTDETKSDLNTIFKELNKYS